MPGAMAACSGQPHALSPAPARASVSFLLNGAPVEVHDPDPSETLLQYLRRSAHLKGTKGVCLQGGCGACTVLLSSPAPVALPAPGEGGAEPSVSHRAVNSCLRPLCSVDGMSVTTVEGVGSTTTALHPVQQQMVDHNASQCGYCTSGFVMSLYSQLKHKGQLSAAQAETIPDGNICRCTGYRPILDAFQSLSCGGCPAAQGAPESGAHAGGTTTATPLCAPEIEDLCISNGRCIKAAVAQGQAGAAAAVEGAQPRSCRGGGASPSPSPSGCGEKGGGVVPAAGAGLRAADPSSGVTWVTVASLEDLFAEMQGSAGKTLRLVCGNTSTGVYAPKEADLLLDVSRVPELRSVKVSAAGITIGGAVTLSELMELLEAHAADSPSYAPLLRHLHRVANYQVRNVGSVVGNLMMTRAHPDFTSDVATLMAGCGASLAVAVVGAHSDSPVVRVDTLSFVRRQATPPAVNDDQNVVVLSLHIPALRKPGHTFLSYKVAQRAVNAHAIVNAAFTFQLDPATGAIREAPTLVFGGLQPSPCRASKTEGFLAGKSATDAGVLAQALDLLASELPPDPSFSKGAYREMLARGFLYKALLATVPRDQLPADLLTTVTPYVRPLSSGQVSFDEGDPAEYPVHKPLHKLSEAIQTTGEAQYLDDLEHAGELHACYVQASHANAALGAVDASQALQLEGVVGFLSAATLQRDGLSNAVGDGEELFASERVVYHGQPVGLVVATSPELAAKAAKLVQVEYSDVQPPILTLDDAIVAGSFFPEKTRELKAGSMEGALAAADVVVEGSTAASHQYHFTMESQRAVALPGEDGMLTVYSSTQNPALIQSVVSNATATPLSKVKVVARRVGGAYGSKLNRCAPVAMAAGLAAKQLGRPVRLVLDLATNMQIVGGRSPYRYSYSVPVTRSGKILGIKLRVLNNHGAHYDFEYPEMLAFLFFIDNVYNVQTWDVEVKVARTNLPACTWIRAPGNVESLFVTETILEHVAAALSLSPEAVRECNLYSPGDITVWGDKLTYCNARLCVDTLKASAEFESRQQAVEAFNASSRWVKRGLSLVPVKYVLPWAGSSFTALVNIFPDGTVTVAHAGCEVGQGLNVKVAQTASYALGRLTSDGCPMAAITIRETTTDVANNTSATGGSIGSELCCMATKGACDILYERLKPVSARLAASKGPAQGLPTWQELIAEAAAGGDAQVDLQARFRAHPGDSGHGPNQYCSFGAGVSEVEVDLLTGEYRILRSDLLLDCGKSLNPAVDIGQVQGAFVMGLGYMLTEEYEYDPTTGKLLSDSTWEYKPPSYADIPIDFRAALLQNSENPYGFLRSKASGEPPLAMACSALFAIRHALVAGQKEVARRTGASRSRSSGSQWLPLPAPASVERVGLQADIPAQVLSI